MKWSYKHSRESEEAISAAIEYGILVFSEDTFPRYTSFVS
jgi:hypothetical protein